MKRIGHSAKIVSLVILSMGLCSCKKQVPVHVVLAGDELFFVLGEEAEIEDVRVEISDAVMNPTITMWTGGCAESGKCPKLRQIKYGQNRDGFAAWTAPKALQKNVEYVVRINMDHVKFAIESFVITDDNKIIVRAPGNFERIEERTVAIERYGNMTIVPYAVTISSGNGNAVITAGSI